ncbi:alpha/beta fold hydrolase [Clostridiisalibacter paucivorans]|uniref:alpha/beta fold hydrolase n=1 Tax=Clostridiisalibacter paucivorans TaxID=408753 RepID=UPI000479BDCF|nr:alpha/beta hydrolase [Clostridiisalibacter paucivorans]
MHIDIDGLRINYICEGEGENVLILHGWGANIDTVIPIYNHIKDRYKVWALDLPGFGQSDRPLTVWGSEEYADFIKKFVDKLNIKDIILMGHSHGGRVSIMLANKYPDILSKMVLIDSAGIIPKRKPKYYLKVYTFKIMKGIYNLLFFWKEKDKRLEKFYKRYGSQDYRAADGIMRKIMVKVINENLRPYLKNINVPTLLVWGRDDDATPLYMGKIMENEIEGSGLVVLDNAGHYSYIDQMYTFNRVIDSFLDSSS